MEHIFIIGDGHRRFAKKTNAPLLDSYKKAAENIRNCIKWILVEQDIPKFSFFCFSYNNVKHRTKFNLDILWKLQNKALISFAKDPLIHENEIKFRVSGEKNLFPKSALEAVNVLESATSDYKNKEFNLLSAYSGALDLEQAIKKTISLKQKICFDNLLRNSHVDSLFDFVVRTANEKRVSDAPLLPLQYAEFGYIKKYFPQITKRDINKVIIEYKTRKGTTFGK